MNIYIGLSKSTYLMASGIVAVMYLLMRAQDMPIPNWLTIALYAAFSYVVIRFAAFGISLLAAIIVGAWVNDEE